MWLDPSDDISSELFFFIVLTDEAEKRSRLGNKLIKYALIMIISPLII